MKKILSLMLAVVLVFSLAACGGSGGGKDGELKIGRAYYAAHGERSFAAATVVLNGDKIVKAYIDEYQVLDKAATIPFPNSDLGFGENLTDPAQAIASKRLNNDFYSALMTENAGATQPLLTSWQAVETFVAGKTVKELETAVKAMPEGGGVDAVAGSTLEDNAGYVNAVIEGAKDAAKNKGVAYTGDVATLKIGQTEFAAHGDKAVAVTTVVLSGDTVVLSYIDEFQFLDKAQAVGVPNSDAVFGESFAEGLALASKRVNNKLYSGLMKEKAGSTVAIADGYDTIQGYVNGKTVAEIEAIANGDAAAAVDAVAGATLEDTAGYLKSVVAAAAQAA